MPPLPIAYRTSDTTEEENPWVWAWPILAFLANVFASNSLHRNQDLKKVFGATEQEWLVSAVLLVAQHLVPFLLICNLLISSEIKDKFKNNLFLNVVLNYLCLSVPALFFHVLQYGGFHIEVEDIEQHNSISTYKLFTACLYAIASLCLSRTWRLQFEAGFFSACLGYAMSVSLSILDKNGKSQPLYISCTFLFCFIFIMFRKYLEKDEGIDRTRQRDNQSSVGTDTAGQSPDSASNTVYLRSSPSRITEPIGGSSQILYPISKPSEPIFRVRDRTSEASTGEYGSDERDVRQESWDGDEHHWEIGPPRLYMDTSSVSGDTAEEEEEGDGVHSVSKCVVKEGKDIIMTHLEVSRPSDEGTSASYDHVDKIKESEVPGQEIGHEEQDMRSSTSSGHMEIAGSSGFGGYEKDDVPLLLPKSDNIIDDEAQSQESGYQGYEKDDNPPLLSKSSLKVDKDSTHLVTSKPSNDDDDDSDHESSDDEGSDVDGFHGGTGRKLGVGRRGKDPGYEKDYVPLLLPKSDNIIDGEAQSQESGYQGYEKDDNPPLLPKSSLKVEKDSTHLGTSKPSNDDDDSDHESFDDEGSDDDGFHGGTGSNLGVGRRGKDPGQESDCQEQGKMRPLRADILEIASSSNLGGDIPLLLSESKNMEVDPGQTGGSVDPRDGIDYEKHGEMKIDSMLRNLTAALSRKKFFCSGSRNYKKDAVTVTPIPEIMRMIFDYYFLALMPYVWSLFMLFIAYCLTTGREFLIKKVLSWYFIQDVMEVSQGSKKSIVILSSHFLFVLTTSCLLLYEFVINEIRVASMANWEMEVTEQTFVGLTSEAYFVYIDILNYQPCDASMANWEIGVTEQSFVVDEEHKHPEIIAPISDMETSSLPKKEHIQGEWQRNKYVGVSLVGKTLAVMGFGKVGSEVTRRAKGLGMHVIAHDPYALADHARAIGVELVSFDEAIATADFISFHMPLTPATSKVLNDDTFAKMKKGVRIFSVARGGIINEDALMRALDTGIVAQPVLYVLLEEPPAKDSKLVLHEKVTATPHLGASTMEAQEGVASEIAEAVVGVLRGELAATAVNAPMFPAEVLTELKPFVDLAEKLGRLAVQLVAGGSGVKTVEVTYASARAPDDLDTRLIRAMITNVFVNLVNADFTAKQIGFRITEERVILDGSPESPLEFIQVQIANVESRLASAISDSGEIKVEGRVKDGVPHLTKVGSFDVDVSLEGSIILCRQVDQPVMMLKVGNVLGQENVDVSFMSVGRIAPRKQAVMAIGVDEQPSKESLKKIGEIPTIEEFVFLKL